MNPRWGTVKERLFSLFYPEICQVCREEPAGKSECYVCEACLGGAQGLQWIERPYCEKCGTPFDGEVSTDFECSDCQGADLAFSSARSAVRLTGVVQHLVHSYKYAHGIWFESLLGGWLSAAAGPVLSDGKWDWIVPVPLHWWKARTRSFNQAERLSRHLSRSTGVPVNSTLLRRRRHTQTQTRLNRKARAENMKKAFEYRPRTGLAGQRIVLVDDVMTTGATASACAKVLRENGAGEVHVWTVARGTLR